MSFIPEEKANSIPKIADGGTTVKGFDVGNRKNPKPKNTSSIIGIHVLSDCVALLHAVQSQKPVSTEHRT